MSVLAQIEEVEVSDEMIFPEVFSGSASDGEETPCGLVLVISRHADCGLVSVFDSLSSNCSVD